MDFEQAQEYLLSLGNEVATMKLGLENIKKLLRALGDPQNNYLKVQVAGTNGKGSVCAFLNSICVSADVRVGMHTSPHLISITERVQFNGVPIGEDDFARLATRIRSVAEELIANEKLESIPTFFEQVTAIALLAFAEAKVDIAILETGLGGRLDATTAANAEIAVITRIDYDHQEYLGETIEAIAGEKAAIIHNDSEVVIGEQTEEAMQVVLKRCAEFETKPRLASDVEAVLNLHGLRFKSPQDNYQIDKLGPGGKHQIENAKSAILAAEILAERFPINNKSIQSGLENARHPGRLEFQGRYLFDGAHNISGAKALRIFLDDEIDTPITMIFGAMKDKDVCEIAEILFPVARTLILTRPNNERAIEPDELERIAKRYVHSARMIKTSTVAEALKLAEAKTKEADVILITGSLYLVGEAKADLS
jgi:dihydrofolate synthase/folylpolyglutamate synthase